MGNLTENIAVNRMTGKVCDERIAKMKHVKRTPIGNLANPNLLFDYTNREIGTLPDDERAHFKWVSEVAYKNIHRIVTRGYDTTELVEAGYGVCDIIFIDFQARIPLVEEVAVLDYVLLTGLEDGLSNPVLVARLVARGKSYLTQACGASVLAYGQAFGAFDSFGKMLDKYLEKVSGGMKIADAAALLVKECRHEDHFSISDLYMKDPAPVKLLDYAEKKLAGKKELKYIPFLREVIKAAQAELGYVGPDMCAAMCAAMMDLGFSSESIWCILAVTRAFAAGAHSCEEIERECEVDGFDSFGKTLTPREWYDGPYDRPVPSLEERGNFKGGQADTPEEWRELWNKKAKELSGSGFAINFVLDDARKVVHGKKKEAKK